MKVFNQMFRLMALSGLVLIAASALQTPSTDNGGGIFTAAAQTVATVNASSYSQDRIVTAGSIAAAFGTFTTSNSGVNSAATNPLPTSLGGVQVRVNNILSGLFFTSPGQINFEVPSSLAAGTFNVVVTNSNATTSTGTVIVAAVAPGVFTYNASGTGVAAALATVDGNVYTPAFTAGGAENPLSAGTSAQRNILVLYGTGYRNAGQANVRVTFQGVPGRVDYVGLAPGFVGLDQINVAIPFELSGFGTVDVRIFVTNITPNPTSNLVKVRIGGQLTQIRTIPIALGQTLDGSLTIEDQVEKDNATGATYFFDAYRLNTTTANQTIAVDLRSAQFDATIIIYRLANDGSLPFVASDDISGGYSQGQKINNNALLATVLTEPGSYLIYATTADSNSNGVGNYTIKLTGNIATQLTYGANLTTTSIASTDLQISTGDYWDVYWFDAVKGDRIQIDMASTAFDAYILLNKNNGDYVDDDDNTGGGTNARITLAGLTRRVPPLPAEIPETGRYILIATPYRPNITGAYTLQHRKTNAPAEEGGESMAAPELPQLPSRNADDVYGGQRANSERFGRRRPIQD